MLLDDVVNSLRAWFDRRGASAKIATVVLVVVGFAVAVTGSVLERMETLTQISVILGSFGGVLILVGLYGLWYAVIPDAQRDKLDLRDRLTLSGRRKLSAVIVAVWLGVALTAGNYVGGPVMGALAVVTFVTAWRLATMKPEEVEELNASLDEEEEEWDAAYRAEQEAGGDDDLPPRPSPLRRFLKGN